MDGNSDIMDKTSELKTLYGDKIVLRPITIEDTELIVKWRNNPMVMKNFIFRKPFTKEMHINWMNTKVAAGEVIQYIAVEKGTDRPIGSVYYRDIDYGYNSAEFGIFIGEDDARGKGYGKEITRLFTHYGIVDLGFHRIQLRLLEGNDAAYKTYEAAGFIKEGVFHDMVRLDAEYKDIIFMAIIADN